MGIAGIPTPENVPFAFPDSRNLRWSYGMSKAIGEASCWAINHESDIDFTIIRVHNVYGPRMGLEHVIPDLITKFLAGDMFWVPDAFTITLNLAIDSEAILPLNNQGLSYTQTIIEGTALFASTTTATVNLITRTVHAPLLIKLIDPV